MLRTFLIFFLILIVIRTDVFASTEPFVYTKITLLSNDELKGFIRLNRINEKTIIKLCHGKFNYPHIKVKVEDIKKIEVSNAKIEYIENEVDVVLKPVWLSKKKSSVRLLYHFHEDYLNLYVAKIDEDMGKAGDIRPDNFKPMYAYYVKTDSELYATKIYTDTRPTWKALALKYFKDYDKIIEILSQKGYKLSKAKVHKLVEYFNEFY